MTNPLREVRFTASLFFCIALQCSDAAAVVLRGVVVDATGARVEGVVLRFDGIGTSHRVGTSPLGEYRIELPDGVYSVSSAKSGFCSISRPAFHLTGSSELRLDFKLRVCAIENQAIVKDGKYLGEKDVYIDATSSETIAVGRGAAPRMQVMINYCRRNKQGNSLVYRKCSDSNRNASQVSAFYELTTIYADELVLDSKNSQLILKGSIIIQENNLSITSEDEIRAQLKLGGINIERHPPNVLDIAHQ